VPREVIVAKDPEIEAIPEDRREVIGDKVSYRLAQRPGSYTILEYRHQVYKLADDQAIVTTPAPDNVLERSAVDVKHHYDQ
jgi:transposase